MHKLFGRRRPARPKWKMILVSHTHWDREWYLPFQRFRAELVATVDTLLDLMAARPDYRYFTLDGQTIVLEDYLEVRPERERDLRHLIARGRILIGPWYVMPDEFLVSGEALVRNLLEGRRIASRFGPPMAVGYIPDSFGHIAQMPQILQGFGIDSAVLWRGTGSRVAKNESIWVAPDGSQVLLEQMPAGYSNAAFLPSSPDALMRRLAQIRAQLEPRATTSYLLLMNGNDHMSPQIELPELIAKANSRLRDAELIHGTLPMLIARIRQEAPARGLEWDRVEGELRSSELAHLLPGVLSTRMWIKQRNSQCQDLLERWAEPFSTFVSLLVRDGETRRKGDGGRDASEGVDRAFSPITFRGEAEQRPLEEESLPRAETEEEFSPSPRLPISPPLLRLAWRYLLMNHAHDSICGCGIDQVHKEMAIRFDWCEQLGDLVSTQALKTVTEMVDTESSTSSSAVHGAVVVFNSENGPRTDFVTATVDLPLNAMDVTLKAPDGREVPHQALRQHQSELARVTLARSELQGYLRLSGPGREWPLWKLRILDKIVRAALRGKMPQLVVVAMDVVPGRDPTTVEIEVEAAAGKEHDYAALAAGMRQLSNLVDRGIAQRFRLRVRRRDRVEIGFVAPEVPAHGYRLFHFEPAAVSRQASHLAQGEATLENEFLSLQVSPEDGTLRLLDRETGSIYWGLNRFVDGGDAGDEYTYSPPEQDLVIEGPDAQPAITVEERGPARQMVRVDFAMRLPAGLTEDRQRRTEKTVLCPATTWLAVYSGVPRVDVRTSFTNLARDHRLRVHFPTGLHARFSHADGQFAVIRRPIRVELEQKGWAEQPVSAEPQLIFVDVNDGNSGLLIANRGLPEYEVVIHDKRPAVALTLLRSVGWLSRDDLRTRQGAAGPQIPTPGAQMLGSYTFEYSIVPHRGGWEEAMEQARWFARPPRALWTERHAGRLGPEASFLTVSPSSLVVSAIKPAERGEGQVVVRVYNVRGHQVQGVLHTWFPLSAAYLSSLAEDRREEIPVDRSHTVRFPVRGYQILTLLLSPRV